MVGKIDEGGQVKKAATDAEANAERDKFVENCVSRPKSCGGVVGTLAAMRETLACAD
jgi:predicted transcriptional regulator of viral defense system